MEEGTKAAVSETVLEQQGEKQEAVSYTHLDVYKRQSVEWSMCSVTR